MRRRSLSLACALAVSLAAAAAWPSSELPLGAWVAEAHPAQRPLTTPTRLPGLDPTPYGRPIAVGTPLPPPAPAADAIGPANVPALIERARLDAPGGPGNAGESVIGFTRDGVRMVTQVDYGRLLVRRMPGGEIALASDEILDGGSFGAQLISPDGQVFATANQTVQGFVDLWDLGAGERLRQHRGGEQVRDLLFTPDGQRLVAARGNGQVQVWDVAGGSLLANYRTDTNGEDAAIAADPVKDELATAGTGRVDLRARDSGEIRRTLRSAALGIDPIGQLRYRSDGDALAAVATRYGGDWNSTEHRIVVWENESQVGTLTFTGRRFAYDTFNWAPDGRSLLMQTSFGIADNQQAQVWLWDGRSTRVEIVAERNRSPRGLAWSPDSRLVAIGLAQTYSSDGQFPGETWLYDVAERSVLRRLPGVVEPWFSPDGAWLVVKGDGVADHDLRLFAVDPAAPITPATPMTPATPTPTWTATPTPGLATPSPTWTATPAPSSAPRPIFLPIVRHDPKPALQADVVLLVDTSSSMSPARLAATRAAVAGFFDLMSFERDQAAIIAFNRSASVALRMTRDRAALERALAGLATAQGRRLDRAIRAARDELLDIDRPGGPRRDWENRGVVILLTDGAHEGPATDVISEAFFTGNSGFRIYTIGLGPDADLGLLGRIADTGGSFAAANEGDLAGAYRAIGARLMQARDGSLALAD